MSGSTKTHRGKPPSRLRYERSHPTVSCRVSLKTYRALDKARQDEGWSFADMLKAGLGTLRADAEMQQKAYEQGHRDAEKRFKVSYPCSVCGRPIAIEGQQAKQSAAQYMSEHGWAHTECHAKKTRGYDAAPH